MARCSITVVQGKVRKGFPMTKTGLKQAQALVNRLLKKGKVAVSGRWSCVKEVI